ncbi:hypothetical protein PXZ03_18835, partial [Acinetobacter baumannii]|uniref:hypothetical protein n=1 Tax=Acinetobacter baumannii TaxID=470 RepID=UPI0026EB9B2D
LIDITFERIVNFASHIYCLGALSLRSISRPSLSNLASNGFDLTFTTSPRSASNWSVTSLVKVDLLLPLMNAAAPNVAAVETFRWRKSFLA